MKRSQDVPPVPLENPTVPLELSTPSPTERLTPTDPRQDAKTANPSPTDILPDEGEPNRAPLGLGVDFLPDSERDPSEAVDGALNDQDQDGIAPISLKFLGPIRSV